jgi:hypothetical protein
MAPGFACSRRIFFTIATTSFENLSLGNRGRALFAVGIAAMRIPSISFRSSVSMTTNAEKKFQKL